ncbi:MAG: hypothetical protein GXO88_02195 [Chlorobi bacterium]|nr:hypothetical protein [Chlorobiota bacterium]
MHKLTILLSSLILMLAFVMGGCEKNPFKPGADNDSHPIVWQYKYDQHQTLSDVVPAMDENGNIFFSIQNGERQKDVYVFANDKDGNALWDKQYSSTNYVDLSRVMYIDKKIVFVVSVYDDLSYFQETIYCVNAVDGTEIWHYTPDFKTEGLIEAMAVTSEYMIVAAKWGGDYPDIDELHYLNLSSGALVKSIDFGDNDVKLISIVGNNAYLGVRSVDAAGFYAPQLVKMELESNHIYWTYTPEYEGEVNYVFKQRSIPLDANNRGYLIVRSQSGVDNMYINIINDDGTLDETITLQPGNFSNPLNDLLIDKDNNFYTVIEGYSKLSPNNSQLWEFQSGTTVPNSRFHTGCAIGNNGIVYHAEDGGILNVNSIGEIDWAKYDETNFTKPGYPLLTEEGNIVVVGDLFVSCVKGDGARIQDAPWPRVYQNNGNTSSR